MRMPPLAAALTLFQLGQEGAFTAHLLKEKRKLSAGTFRGPAAVVSAADVGVRQVM